jgi:plasmid maintenance system antidote protein VapI
MALTKHCLTCQRKMCSTYYMQSKRRYASMTQALKAAIADSELSFKALERETGVKRQSLMKFADDQQSLRLDVADRLATYFGLEVTSKPKK